jgi:hypothetical protein
MGVTHNVQRLRKAKKPTGKPGVFLTNILQEIFSVKILICKNTEFIDSFPRRRSLA